jgi:hypothetical protein
MLVDLSAVSFVDTAGRSLLSRMHLAGFRLAGSGTMTSYLVQQIDGSGELGN